MHHAQHLVRAPYDALPLGDDSQERLQIVHGTRQPGVIGRLLGCPEHGWVTCIPLGGRRVNVGQGTDDGLAQMFKVRDLPAQISCKETVIGVVAVEVEVEIDWNRGTVWRCVDVRATG